MKPTFNMSGKMRKRTMEPRMKALSNGCELPSKRHHPIENKRISENKSGT